ncbi:MAG: ATP-binding cassette domain-containing protein [SAR324 cluster bacterium]|nr:ATP-binding cassette domain-containing protein [SAR324 cluster bacterium]
MLEVAALEVNIGTANILREVNLSVPDGSMCGLIGRNGAGKTTLIRSVMGLSQVRSGSILFDRQELLDMQAYRRARLGIGFMPEDRGLVPNFTTEDNLLVPAWAAKIGQAEERLAWIYKLMPEVEAFAKRRANQLSGGQQKMVALARALMCGTKLLLLDEPFEGLAPVLARRVAEVLSNLKREGLSILVAESNEKHVADMLDHINIIERGSIQSG